jgi:hypothetical protein
MNFSFRRAVRWVIFWSAASGLCLTAGGQTPPALTVATPGTTMTVASNLPPLPVFQPRTELFRKILAMPAAQQEAWLTNRSPQVRPQLEAKIREYQAMSPSAREAVLRATQLHEYLEYFIKAPAADRSNQLAQVPLEYRDTISAKLREFDLLPPELQQEVLAGKTTANYFLNPRPPLARTARRANPPMPPPPMPLAPLGYLSRLSSGQRQEMYSSFEHFFDLDNDDQQKVLSTLPPTERGPVEKTLRDLEHLPREQRDRGLQSISALAGMPDEQRQAFFKNAELWRELPPAERQTWRKVVAHLPPMPPDPTVFEGSALATNPAN